MTGQFYKIKIPFYKCHCEKLIIKTVFLLQILQKYHYNSPAWIAKIYV